jgi:hypothetical protein
LRRNTSAFASPVRRLRVREIWRTARAIERERVAHPRPRLVQRGAEPVALVRQRPRPLQRPVRVGRVADVGLHYR